MKGTYVGWRSIYLSNNEKEKKNTKTVSLVLLIYLINENIIKKYIKEEDDHLCNLITFFKFDQFDQN